MNCKDTKNDDRGTVAQVVEHLPSMTKALSAIPSTLKKSDKFHFTLRNKKCLHIALIFLRLHTSASKLSKPNSHFVAPPGIPNSYHSLVIFLNSLSFCRKKGLPGAPRSPLTPGYFFLWCRSLWPSRLNSWDFGVGLTPFVNRFWHLKNLRVVSFAVTRCIWVERGAPSFP